MYVFNKNLWKEIQELAEPSLKPKMPSDSNRAEMCEYLKHTPKG